MKFQTLSESIACSVAATVVLYGLGVFNTWFQALGALALWGGALCLGGWICARLSSGDFLAAKNSERAA